MIIDYSNIESISELKTKYGNLFESKVQESLEDEKKETKTKKKIHSDDLDVIYTDFDQEPSCIFKHIIVFTNDKSDNNKTLNNIKDAIKVLKDKPKLHVFISAEAISEEDEATITINDDDDEFVINKESNLDTLVFSRLGVLGEDNCEHVVKLLQDRGFLVLNSIRPAEIACDKYETACLLESANVPQPRFCLMTKKILYDEDSFKEQITRVYEDYDFNDPDKNKELDVVVKILDGHGGTGVFTVDLKKCIAILQAIFAIDPERKLIIQKKEEADGGDIRVHILTLRNKQIILGAMKRVKIGGDFRSNVSLGAQAEPVKLTPEQEQIALKVAAISRLPWCAVDIMPLVKGSNKEIGDNVVLEYNASPGSAGISEVLDKNFINILFNELNDPSEFMLQDKTAGFVEAVSIKFSDKVSEQFLAKLDTGNSTTASVLEVGEYKETDKDVTFTIKGKKLTFEKDTPTRAKAGEEVYERPVIVVPELTCGLRKVQNVRIAVVKSRANKASNMLLNRDIISKLGYVVNPSVAHILTPEIERTKILS